MTIPNPKRLQQALQAFDEANSHDPKQEDWHDGQQPAALLYGWRMSECLQQFLPDASEALQLAIRAQHIERWRIPRDSYPMDRKGYYQWRQYLAKFHAERAGEILHTLDYPVETIERVQALLQRLNRRTDAESQIVEDVACLVFMQYYLADFAADKSEEKMLGILRKTWAKMSSDGQQAALKLPLATELREMIDKALTQG